MGLLRGNPELARDELVDPQVRLVEQEQVDVLDRAFVRLERLADHLGHADDGVLEDEPALHPGVDPPLVDHLVRELGAEDAPRCLGPELLRVLPLGVQVHRQDAALRVVGGREKDRPGSVSEDDGQVPPPGADVEPRRVHLGPDDEHSVVLSRPDVERAHVERIEEPGALAANVHDRDSRDPESVLEERRRSRELVLGRERRHDDRVEILRLELRGLERPLDRLVGEIDGARSLVHPVPFYDARALLDPLVGRLHPLLEIPVGDDARRHVHPRADDPGSTESVHG